MRVVALAVLLLVACKRPGPTLDDSLTVAEYVQRGMPAPDKPWTGADRRNAAGIIADMIRLEPNKLPRYGSPNSGTLFAKFVERNALERCERGNQQVDEQMSCLLDLGEPLQTVTSAYVRAAKRELVTGREVVELFGMQLHIAAAMTVPALQLPGRAEWQERTASMLRAALFTLTQRPPHRTEELLVFVNYIGETMPKLYRALTPTAQAALKKQLDELIDDPDLSDFRPRLRQLRSSVQ